MKIDSIRTPLCAEMKKIVVHSRALLGDFGAHDFGFHKCLMFEIKDQCRPNRTLKVQET